MAIIKGWLEYTKGSIGNITFRRGVSSADGKRQTVASQKVTSVENPQSLSQCYQRMKIATVQHTYSGWQKAESNAYTNSKYGFSSRLRFLKDNLNADNEDLYISPAPKGYIYPVPGIYKISNGSLKVDTKCVVKEVNGLNTLYPNVELDEYIEDIITLMGNWNEGSIEDREAILDSESYLTFMRSVRNAFGLETLLDFPTSTDDWTIQLSYVAICAEDKESFDAMIANWSHLPSTKTVTKVGRMILGKYVDNGKTLNTVAPIDWTIQETEDGTGRFVPDNVEYILSGGIIVSKYENKWERNIAYSKMRDELYETSQSLKTFYAESYQKEEADYNSEEYLNYGNDNFTPL